jgi:hypothetical protein
VTTEQTRAVTVGLLAVPPDAPADVAAWIAEHLPRDLAERVDDHIDWDVRTGYEDVDARGADVERILDVGAEHREREGWDVVICFTDVPLQAERKPLVAYASVRRRAGLISLPALGVGQHRYARSTAVGLVDGLLAEAWSSGPPRDDGRVTRLVETVAPIRRVVDQENDGEVAFGADPVAGALRLVLGMVRANRPGRAVVGLSKLLVAAIGTAAFALATDTLWTMGDALDPPRLALVMLIAQASLITYLIVGHGLWERVSDTVPREQARLFNAGTALTLILAVAVLYAGLLAATTFAALLLIDASVLESALGRPVGLADYVKLAWFVSSLATVGGAVGSGLEDEDQVRAAAYGEHPGVQHSAPAEPAG